MNGRSVLLWIAFEEGCQERQGMAMLLETIGQANDIKKIRKEDLGDLAQEIRDFLIRTISVTGGHLGANLGAVELTMNG